MAGRSRIPGSAKRCAPGGRCLPGAGRCLPGLGRYLPGGGRCFPGAVQHLPGAVQRFPGVGRHLPGAVQRFPGVGRHLPGAVQHLPRVGRHLPRAVQHVPGAAQHLPGAGTRLSRHGGGTGRAFCVARCRCEGKERKGNGAGWRSGAVRGFGSDCGRATAWARQCSAAVTASAWCRSRFRSRRRLRSSTSAGGPSAGAA